MLDPTLKSKYVDLSKDVKPLHEDGMEWIPAANVSVNEEGMYMNENGHVVGWVPLQPGTLMYKWHATAVRQQEGVMEGFFLNVCDDGFVRPSWCPLVDYVNCTVELVGPKIGTAYDFAKLGCLRDQHFLVVQGALVISDFGLISFETIREYVERNNCEGIVFHCTSPEGRALFKVHQHHLGLTTWRTDPSHTRFVNLFPPMK